MIVALPGLFSPPFLRSQISYSFVKYGCSIYTFLSSANLICRGTDISKLHESPLIYEVTGIDCITLVNTRYTLRSN